MSQDKKTFKPFVSPETNMKELTVKSILVGSLFGVIFGAATVYLALKAGLTVSASIPIAVLSIAVFKRLGRSTILENNIVQTIGSPPRGAPPAAGGGRPAPPLHRGRQGIFPLHADHDAGRGGRRPGRAPHGPAAAGPHREGAREPS